MKNIDRLLSKAKALLAVAAGVFFPDDMDSFMEALGVDLEKYKRINPDESIGYDFIQALRDTAAEDWKEDSAEGQKEIELTCDKEAGR